jgi:hypothetical protein
MARRNPVKAPSNPSVMERLLNVRRPWPVKRNPVYAIVTVHTIARTRISDLPFRWNSPLALTNTSCSGNIPLGPFCASSEDLFSGFFPDPPHLARMRTIHMMPLLANEPKNSREISHMRFYSALPRSQSVRPDGDFRSHSASGTAHGGYLDAWH